MNGGVDQRTVLLLIRAVWGTVLLAWPGPVAGGRDDGDRRWRVFGARALGARHLLQSGLLARHMSRRAADCSIWIDALHASSMLALAAIAPGLRRDALGSAAIASAFAAATAYAR